MKKSKLGLWGAAFFLVACTLFLPDPAFPQSKADPKKEATKDEVVENRPVQFIGKLELDIKDKALSGSSITLAQNSKGDFYLVKDFPPRILIFDKEGKFQSSFGDEGDEPGKILRPFGVAIDKQDMVYISDIKRGKILTFTPLGDFVEEFSSRSAASGDDKFPHATGCISVNKKKNQLYITDAGNGHIWVHGLNGKLLQHFRGKKSGFCTPGAVRFDEQGRVYVPECACNRIRAFEEDGREVFQIGGSGDLAGQFSRLNAIDIDSKRRLYAVDMLLKCVQVFSPEGKFIGAIKWLTDDKGENIFFKRLVYICIGLDDQIFIVDQGTDQVYVVKDNNPL